MIENRIELVCGTNFKNIVIIMKYTEIKPAVEILQKYRLQICSCFRED